MCLVEICPPLLPTPFSPVSVPLPPETGGRGHTSLRVGGWGGGSPNSDEGHTLWYSLYVRTLCPQYLLRRDGGHEQLISNGERFKPAFAEKDKKQTMINLRVI